MPTPRRSEPLLQRFRWPVIALVALLVLLGLGLGVRRALTPAVAVACSATVGGATVVLTPAQMGNAATIAGIAVRRGLPARAATIAIATAMQESKLSNLAYGDRDSLGLFQQRPSQGWGTRSQVLDPVYAANAFYDVLVKVAGYRSLPITTAAQRVQRSAYPQAYAQHETQARVLASALSGNSPAALTCALDGSQAPAGATGLPGLDAALATEQPRAASRSAGPAGLRLEAASPAQAWASAHWAVGRSDQLGVARVYAGGQVWVRAQRDRGWASATGPGVPATGSREVVVLLSDIPPG